MSQRQDYSSGASFSSSGESECCPLVVDPLTLFALLSFIGAAVYLLNEQIAMSNLMMAKRKRRNLLLEGKELENILILKC